MRGRGGRGGHSTALVLLSNCPAIVQPGRGWWMTLQKVRELQLQNAIKFDAVATSIGLTAITWNLRTDADPADWEKTTVRTCAPLD